jgi:hypothetical protein
MGIHVLCRMRGNVGSAAAGDKRPRCRRPCWRPPSFGSPLAEPAASPGLLPAPRSRWHGSDALPRLDRSRSEVAAWVSFERRSLWQTNDAAEQQIVVELRHQLPLGTDAIEGLPQQRAQQLFGRDHGASVPGVESSSLRVEGLQSLIGDATDQAKRVTGGDPALRANVAEEPVSPNVFTPHPKPPTPPIQ